MDKPQLPQQPTYLTQQAQQSSQQQAQQSSQQQAQQSSQQQAQQSSQAQGQPNPQPDLSTPQGQQLPKDVAQQLPKDVVQQLPKDVVQQLPKDVVQQLIELLQAEQHWLATEAQLPSGAITTGSNRIVPYFSNIGALGWTTPTPQVNPEAIEATRRWMEWFIAHLNRPDRFGVNGTVYDYAVAGDGTETSNNDYDSADSYPATFVTLVLRYVRATGDVAWARSHAAELDLMGQAMVAAQDPADHLTWAKPNYKVKYLMDNCEVYRGFADLATLMADVIGNSTKAAYYRQRAADVQAAIEKKLWAGDGRGFYYYAMDQRGVRLGSNWRTWYPDQMAQLWPVLWGVLDPESPRAKDLWARFNRVAGGWPTLDRGDAFASPFIALVALKMDQAAANGQERERVRTYVSAVKARFFDQGNPWPWYSADAGWFMLVLEGLLKGEVSF